MRTKRRWSRLFPSLLLQLAVLAAAAAAGCSRRSDLAASLIATPTPEPMEQRPVEGSHSLTASPPVTPPDLRRMLDNGFTVETLVSEIQRRGVLRRPDADACRQVEALPEGQRLLDAMQSPRNLLSPSAVAGFAQRQGGSVPAVPSSSTARSGLTRARSASDVADQQQQLADYQRRRLELDQKIQTMKERRRQMQRRGEGVHLIGIEIDRLERESAALAPPPGSSYPR